MWSNPKIENRSGRSCFRNIVRVIEANVDHGNFKSLFLPQKLVLESGTFASYTQSNRDRVVMPMPKYVIAITLVLLDICTYIA